MQEIIINKDKEDNKIITLVENGKIVEYYEEKNNYVRLEGNIYIGKVQNIILGMQAAFVDIGHKENAFIHIKDVIPKASNLTGNKNEQFSKYNIKDYIRQGMPILVQVKRDGTYLKASKISTSLSLPGRFIVLLPKTEFITISKKIDDDLERNRLQEIVKNILPDGFGAIIRTSAVKQEQEKIEEELKKLLNIYLKIEAKMEKIEQNKKNKVDFKPEMVYENNEIIKRLLIDLGDQNLKKITTNCENSYNLAKKYIEDIKESDKIKIELKKEESILDIYNLENQISKLKNKKIWLKCGGFIVIDKTEAFTAIDVNSGKFVGKNKTFEETVYTVNKEASIEIAKQVRLRDIGGIIIIDYINMEKDENKNKILEVLQKELKKDRSKTQVIGFTSLNLLEMTRKHMWSNED